MNVPAPLGWTVLALVFVDELAAVTALGVAGWQLPSARALSWVLVWLLPLAGVTAWSLFASPRATRATGVRRVVTKVLVFGVASVLLWAAGHPGWALALAVFSVVVNVVALHPSVYRLAQGTEARGTT